MTDRSRVALWPTCVVDVLAPSVAEAATRVLRRLGAEVTVARGTTCCGQPAHNAGFVREAARVARTSLHALERSEADVVCLPAGSCATMVRVFWPEIFEAVGDPDSRARAEALRERVVEFSELVARCPGVRGRLDATVAYHHSCHMLRELGLRSEPVAALEGLDGCRVASWDADDRCCGFGGTFSVKLPEVSVAMADDKLDSLAASGADMLVGCDQSCLVHLHTRMRRLGWTMPVHHLAEVLDEAMDAVT